MERTTREDTDGDRVMMDRIGRSRTKSGWLAFWAGWNVTKHSGCTRFDRALDHPRVRSRVSAGPRLEHAMGRRL